MKALWNDVIGEAMEEAGISATPEQIAIVASAAESMHENYGQAVHVPESPLIRENAELRRELAVEASKVVCPECRGRGSSTSHGPSHSSTSRCWKCNGSGKITP